MNKRNKKQVTIASIISIIAAATLYFYYPQATQKIPTKPASTQSSSFQQIRPRPTKRIVYPDTIPGKIITLKKLSPEFTFDYYTMFSADVRKSFEHAEKISYGEVDLRIRGELRRMKKNLMITYTIWDNTADRLVGSIRISEKDPEDPGQLSMWLNENYRGGGRIQEALFLISQAYFKTRPNTKNYNAYVRTWNIASRKSMEKFGFKHVGTGTFVHAGADPNKMTDAQKETQIYELTRETIRKKALLRK